ncbi:hypothetical protein [Streptomyces sp. RG80]|uniref:hypothetical protein n=1 Tax=Streptomyces sp. RG80 TaxID=3157340 RepID=UPI00338DE459
MNEPAEPAEQPPPESAAIRFDATVHPGITNHNLRAVADLDLDRMPDPEDEVRLLVTPEDCRRLLESGYEVHLRALVPVRPVPAELVATDESVMAWLDERVQGIERSGGA